MQTISLPEAVAMIPDGARLTIGGFTSVGPAERIIDENVTMDAQVTANGNEDGVTQGTMWRPLRR